MEEWKVRQQLFRKFAVKRDLIPQPVLNGTLTNDQLIEGITLQFNDSEVTTHPFKSYCVALVYSLKLAEKYGASINHYLNDVDLLPDDPCFVRYAENSSVYDYFLNQTWWATSPMGSLITEYWVEEYCDDIQYA